MASTYSVGTQGASASVPLTKIPKIEDAYCPQGAMQYAMMKGLPVQIKGQDGQLHTTKFDAERWSFATPILNPLNEV